jgi:hypothetical protein
MNIRTLALAAAMSVAASGLPDLSTAARATPLAVGAAAVPAAVPQYVVDAQYRRVRRVYVPRRIYYRRVYRPRYYYYPGWYYPSWYYPGPVLFAPWAFAPPPVYTVRRRVYVAPGPYRRCWIRTDDRGFGYWGACRR